MAEIKVGLIAAPEFPTHVANELIEELPDLLKEAINEDYKWIVEEETDEIITIAEDKRKLLDGVIEIQDRKEWDYTLCLTDIPIFYQKNILLGRVHPEHRVAILSLPALGWFINKRIESMVLEVMTDLYYESTEETRDRADEELTFSTVKKIKVREDDHLVLRYHFSSNLIGFFTLLSGMTYDNQPWKIMGSLKSVIAVAFGSGAYGIIFPTLWMISYNYSPWRLGLLMILAILGLGLWIIQGHNLWETETISGGKTYKWLYNLTTISTLFLAVGAFYIVLYFLFLMTALIFVEPEFYMGQVNASSLPTLMNYLQVAWITASVGTITGAVGVGLENEEDVRSTTYGYRQRARYRQMQRRKEEDDTESSE